jgi:hypothetical protein
MEPVWGATSPTTSRTASVSFPSTSHDRKAGDGKGNDGVPPVLAVVKMAESAARASALISKRAGKCSRRPEAELGWSDDESMSSGDEGTAEPASEVRWGAGPTTGKRAGARDAGQPEGLGDGPFWGQLDDAADLEGRGVLGGAHDAHARERRRAEAGQPVSAARLGQWDGSASSAWGRDTRRGSQPGREQGDADASAGWAGVGWASAEAPLRAALLGARHRMFAPLREDEPGVFRTEQRAPSLGADGSMQLHSITLRLAGSSPTWRHVAWDHAARALQCAPLEVECAPDCLLRADALAAACAGGAADLRGAVDLLLRTVRPALEGSGVASSSGGGGGGGSRLRCLPLPLLAIAGARRAGACALSAGRAAGGDAPAGA